MNLSQKLTRAGLTFILLGSVASVMPDNDAAQASTATCSNGTKYRLSTNGYTTGGDSGTSTTISNGTYVTTSLKVAKSTDGTNFSQAYANISFDGPGKPISFSNTGDVYSAPNTSTVTVYPNSANKVVDSIGTSVTADFLTGPGGTSAGISVVFIVKTKA